MLEDYDSITHRTAYFAIFDYASMQLYEFQFFCCVDRFTARIHSLPIMNGRLFDEWVSILRDRKVEAKTVYQGDKMIFPDKTQVSVIWPKKDHKYSELNLNSIVVEISFGNFNALLTGDAGEEAQPYTSSSSEVEVFKAPHHGAKASLNETYVASLSPQISIISVGAKNPYGHPSQDVINFLNSIGSKVYRTDKNGTVEIVSNGISWYTRLQHD